MLKLFILLMASGFAFQSYAARFSNSYTEFELPPGWICEIEGSEWVCQSQDANRQKEAIIILAAKKRGDQDNISNYHKYLEQTKEFKLPGAGKTQKSEPKKVERRKINGHEWVDALHLASEVPGFYTRYLATTKADIGVAITFSVTKSLYSEYKETFDNVIKSMRIFRQNGSLAGGTGTLKRPTKPKAGFFDPLDDPTGIGTGGTGPDVEEPEKGGGNDDMVLYAIIGAIALGIFLKMKGGKKKAAPAKKKKKKKVKKS